MKKLNLTTVLFHSFDLLKKFKNATNSLSLQKFENTTRTRDLETMQTLNST